MNKITINPGTVQETLLIPLYARKKCSDKFPALYTDPAAAEICSRIDYDFSELDKKYETFFYEFGSMEGAMRQLDMMYEINDYIKKHPGASIVCLGCGLDVDPRRCGTEENKIYNVDFPDVISAREELAGVHEREVNIISDLTDISWMDKINGENGVVLYASGVFHYLKREDVKKIIIKLAEKFPGGRLLFDTLGKRGYKTMMKKVLKSHGMPNFGELFYSGNPVKDLSPWSDKIKVSARGYMLGYYDMKAPGVKKKHRFLAKVGDKIMHMSIVKVEF